MAFDPSAPVLVVDGHDAEIQVVRALLRQLGCADVDDATNVAEALAKMRSKRYSLVIANWDMAPVTGCDFLHEARSDPRLNRIAFIMTGESRSSNVIAAKKAGAACYIVRPFNAQTLKIKIAAALATKVTPLPERQHAVGAAQSRQSGEADASAASRPKFDGVFTISLK
jgi:two-component system, chemotaxis family, chemotaxis protein CheY